MEGQLKPKVTARVDFDRGRPASPFKSPATSLSPPLVRPKAKVNSSATIHPRKPAPPVSTPPSRGSVVSPRAPSPFKPPQSRAVNASPSANAAVKARLTARTNGHNSTSPLPESRQRALTAGSPSHAPSFPRQRRGSVSSNLIPSSSHADVSTALSPGRSALSLSSQPDENNPTPTVPASSANVNVRVKAKISKVAGHGVHSPPSLPSSPLLTNRPARVPSISNLSLSPPMMPSNAGHSLSTTATPSPSAPPNRFGSTRETKHHSFQPIPKTFQAFVPNDDLAVDYGGIHKIAAKVDPTAIPLPPQSPPISTISFSSRSSASRSSVSYETQDSGISRSTAPTLNSHVNSNGHARHGSRSSQPRARIDGSRSAPMTREPSSNSEPELSDEYDGDERLHADDGEDEERKMKAQAKSNRKIADLEITNRSLLAINTTLEATKHRQQKEIRELRRKLRESRLILPPPAYRAVKSSLTYDDTAEEEDDDDEDDDDEDDKEIVEGKADEAYRRVKGMIDSLLDSGRRALESTPEDFVGSSKTGGAKVLTAEEVRSWRGDNVMLDVDMDNTSMSSSRPLTPSQVAVPDSDDGLGSEDEVEASLLEPDSPPPAPLPPITITPSASP